MRDASLATGRAAPATQAQSLSGPPATLRWGRRTQAQGALGRVYLRHFLLLTSGHGDLDIEGNNIGFEKAVGGLEEGASERRIPVGVRIYTHMHTHL